MIFLCGLLTFFCIYEIALEVPWFPRRVLLLQFCECPSPSDSPDDKVARTHRVISQTVGFTICVYLFLLLAPYSPAHPPRQGVFTASPTHTPIRHRSLLLPVPNLKYISASLQITTSQPSISGSQSTPVNLVSYQSYPVLTSHRVNSWLPWRDLRMFSQCGGM